MNNRLVRAFTTVTPLSKTLALLMLVALPFGGFYYGLNMRVVPPSPIVINKTILIEPTPTPEQPEVTSNYQKGDVYIKDGTVYYIEGNGSTKSIGKSEKSYTGDNINQNYEYKEATISPNKHFVLMSGVGWETDFEDIYDLRADKIYSLESRGATYWLSDGRIIIMGGLGLGIDSGIYQSVNANQPWKLVKVGEAIN